MTAIQAAIAEGRPTFGIVGWTLNGLSAEVLGRVGFDWIMVDIQHGGVTWDGLLAVIQGLHLGGTPAIVRVGWNDPAQIMRALDLGAIGVVVPMISTADDARAAAQAARYPPDGLRSFGPVRNLMQAAQANRQVLCLPMIETAEAMRNLAEIAATPGVNGLVVGPVDLAMSMGLEADYTQIHPQVFDAVDGVVTACRANGIVPGAFSVGGPPVTAELLRRGVTFISVGGDAGYLHQGAHQDIELIKGWRDA